MENLLVYLVAYTNTEYTEPQMFLHPWKNVQ